MARTFYRKKFSDYLGEQRAIDDVVLFYTNDPTPSPTPSLTASPTPTPSITPSHTPTGTPNTTPTTTPTPTATTPICWDSFTISGSSISELSNGTYQEMITYSGGSLDGGWVSGATNSTSIFISGTAPDGNDYKVFGSYDGTYYYTYSWAYLAVNNESWSVVKSTGNYWILGGTAVDRVNMSNSTGSTTPNGVYYYPIAQTYGGFPTYTLTRGNVCPTPTPTQTNTSTPTSTPTGTPQPTPTNTSTPTSSPAPPFDSDAAAYLEAIVSAGATGITSTVSAATNTLVTSLKSAGIWSLIDAAYPFLGGNYNGVKFNIKDPQDTNGAYRISFNGSWTINTSGATPSSKSSSNYGDTYWNPYGTAGNRNDNHHYYRYVNQISNLSCDYAGVAGPYLIMGACPQLEFFDGAYSISNGGVVSGTQGYSQAISRLTSSDVKTYRKLTGGSWTNYTSSSTAPGTFSSNSMYIGTVNGANFPEEMRYAFLSYGQGLTQTQMGDLDSIVSTFNTTLGRNF